MTTKNPIAGWDFTISCDHITKELLVVLLRDTCKKFCFQKEQGETGYLHFQGRISLKNKTRNIVGMFPYKFHWSPTTVDEEAGGGNFYVTKLETRVDGPWTDKDEVIYVPRQIREITKLWEWQEKVIEISAIWDKRGINIIYCPEGNSGKSTLKGWMRAYKLGRPIPFCTEYKDIMRMVMDMPDSGCYLIDIPRAMKKEHLHQFFAGIESIKDGYAYDDRYKFQEKYFDCPNIFVFTNKIPNLDLLSKDRWNIWIIREKKLIPYSIEEDD